jgi:hypothetical protein
VPGLILLVALLLSAGTLAAQSGPPYSGYTNVGYTTGTGDDDYIDDVTIRRGSTTLLQNLNTGGAASPYNSYYGSLGSANLVPGQQHSIDITITQYWSEYISAWIDYNNDGDFLDSGENLINTLYLTSGSSGTINFTPPSGVGGVLRLRLECVYGTTTHVPNGSYTYGEVEDYLVNLGFAIDTASQLPSGAEQQPYNTTITATNGVTPYNWNTTISGLPPGITASQSGNDLVLSGTPTAGSAGTYSFNVSASDSDSPPSNSNKGFSIYIDPPPAPMPFSDDFSTDKGWNLGTGWQRGSATAFTGNTSVGPTRTEPGSDHTTTSDNMILGHDIGNDYGNGLAPAYASSPPINCSSATNVQLRFYRWLGINSGDTAKIQVSNNGTTWTDVYDNGTSSVNTPSQWELVAYDITSVAAGNAVVHVRFQLGPTDSSIVNVGWCIDDVEILDPGPPLEVREGGLSGTIITDNEAVGGLRDVGTVNVSTQAPITIGIINNGVTAIDLSGFSVNSKVGANPGDFTLQLAGVPASLAVGASCTFNIVFYRTTPGVSTATIQIPHNATGSGTSPFDINVKGEAVQPIPYIQVDLTVSGGQNIPHQASATGTARDFGQQDVNAGPSPEIIIAVTNVGTGTLTLAVDMGGLWWNQYAVNTSAPYNTLSQLGANQSTTFGVAFDPTSTGVKDAFVRITHNDGSVASPYEVPVTGVGVNNNQPILNVNDGTSSLAHDDPATGTARDFGNVQVGNTAGPLTITVTNNGGSDLTVNNIVLGGPDAAEFSLNTAGFVSPITPGNSSTFEISFSPTSAGQKDAWVEFDHDDPAVTSPFRVNVTGHSVLASPTITVREGGASGNQLANPAPASGILDFGPQDINTGPTAAAVIYIENTGTANLDVGAPGFLSATTEFNIQATGFPATLAPGNNITFSITFDPTLQGTQTAIVEFTHNDSSTASPFRLNLTGVGILNAPLIQVHETTTGGPAVASSQSASIGGGRDCGSIDVSAGATGPITIVIMNFGTLDLNLGNPTLTGANAGDFIVGTGSFNNVVTPGNSTQIDVSFDPTLGGIKDANLQFGQDDPSQPDPFIVPVRGTAIDPAGVQIVTGTLPPGAAGSPYGPVQLQASQGSSPYTWSLYSGTLPAGMNLSATGQLDGTPGGLGGSYRVTIRVTDQNGATDEQQYNIAVSGIYTGKGRATSGGGCAAEADNGTGLALLIGALVLMSFVVYRRRRA